MRESFKVAGHIFNISLSDRSGTDICLDQYSPFVIPFSDTPLFSLEQADEVPDDGKAIVYAPETEEGETIIRLYSTADAWLVEMAPNASCPVTANLWLSRDFTSGKLVFLSGRAYDKLFSLNNSLMLMYAFATAGLNTLEMHASMVENGGKAYLFIAMSGTGKSTHSNLWMEHIPGTSLMNDDNPIVRVWPDGRVIAYGSPWSGKTPCYKNVEAPVGAIVRIRRCAENRIARLGGIESYLEVNAASSGFRAHEGMSDGLHATLEKVVTTIPCYVLDCRPDKEAAEVCAAEVRKV